VPEVSKRRQRTVGGAEAHGTARAKARSQRHRTGDRTKVATMMRARDNGLFEHQKVIL
jgi:hypothetical protein